MAQLAQALYDNAAESPEELSFRRGDVMLVLERDDPSLGGWWRCSLRGQQGIAPGNRLQLIPETPQQESEYQAPRFLGVNVDAGKLQKYEKGAQEKREEPKNEEEPENQTGAEVYQVPSIARLRLSGQPANAQDDIYNSPRLVGSCIEQPLEVYDTPSALRKDPLSTLDTYDSPALRVKAADSAAQVPEEIPEDIYDVPPTFNKSPSDDEEDEGVYSMPSNLKRVSGLQNLYEAPEDILSSGHLPEILPPPPAQRLSVCSTGSTRSADSAGSRESNIPPLSIWEPRNDGTCTMEGLRMLHQELQVSIAPVLAGAEKSAEPGGQEDSGTTKKVLGALRDFLVMAHVAGLRSCQASDPALHRELSVHLDQLENAARELLDKGSERPLIQLIQEHSNCFVRLVSANAGLLFPRPRLSSSESLSRRPLPALPTASPAIQRKGSIQDRPLPPPPTLQHVASDPSDDIHSEYERIQCRDNHYVHLQGSITAQNISKRKDRQKDTGQGSTLEEREVDPFPEASEEDRHLLHFYATQSHSHLQTLLSCVGTFLGSASSQPPRVFVGHGKQLVIAAHKLVFIGDTLGRLLSCPQLQTRLAGEGAALCQALKDVVLATKEAATLYPAPAALKAMAGTVSVLCTCAHSFTHLLQHLAT
ncbi:embryonal Fyn-associated substrate L homeolog [Xenopus laevis]|uniref:Embryonal Fyn-associated substrate L homeolog n=1 Tax=Xenopus laevis TaxID=8355 RepID=Q5XG33_XENLA|nr:embryonal Fyn-associated substrate L homeolog [Xenopus laevis]AAH84637.1 LOC495224 protein [Xenopus laevis]